MNYINQSQMCPCSSCLCYLDVLVFVSVTNRERKNWAVERQAGERKEGGISTGETDPVMHNTLRKGRKRISTTVVKITCLDCIAVWTQLNIMCTSAVCSVRCQQMTSFAHHRFSATLNTDQHRGFKRKRHGCHCRYTQRTPWALNFLKRDVADKRSA
jgi:hypothetical protein